MKYSSLFCYHLYVKRILIFGRSGSGKSTLASKLGQKLGFPVFHLDRYYWSSGWIARPKEDMTADIEKILSSNDTWIIDGNFKRSALETRIQQSDLIILLDFRFATCLRQAIWRHFKYRNKVRLDMHEGCPQKFDLAYIKFQWNQRKTTINPLLKILSSFPEKKVVKLKNPAQVSAWFEKL